MLPASLDGLLLVAEPAASAYDGGSGKEGGAYRSPDGRDKPFRPAVDVCPQFLL